MDIAFLREFIVSVPTCVETDSLIGVWQSFQRTDCEQIVVVDEQQTPLGTLSLRRLLPYLLENSFLGDSAPMPGAANVDGQPLPESLPINLPVHLQTSIRSLRQLSQLHNQPLVEPLNSLPIYWSLEQLRTCLPEIGQRQWVLIDSAGQYLGLLDRLRLLQFLASYSTLESHLPLSCRSPSQAEWQAANPEIATRKAAKTASALTILDPLLDLLERLPIPLMLQTTPGRVITQNLAWRQQVGALQDPGQVRREAAQILETTASETPHSSSRRYSSVEAIPPHGRSPESHSEDLDGDRWDGSSEATIPDRQQASSCQLGTEPNACVCICPMKNGQERVWQFIKVPMGTTALQHETRSPTPVQTSPSQAPHSPKLSPTASDPLAPFKLATLDFSPDAGWRSLAQTEELWLVLAQDMTEQQQVARELAAKNADLIQLNRLKDEFLACISHELKTPLTAVLGLSSLLKDQSLGALNARQARYAQLIHQSGRHLILIVNDILDLTRIETGQLVLMLEPVQIERVCRRAYEQARQFQPLDVDTELQPGETQTEAQFSLEIQPGVEKLVADELRLRQMLVNLLSNALKFTESEGKIGLKVEMWDGWIAFTVWDTGIGISADKQHLIFQKFQQLENPMTRRYEGTGLGLVLTQRLARLHGGDVTFTSVENQGSEFTLLLPPCPPQATAEFAGKPRSVQPSAITSSNRLVLVVETTQVLLDNLTNQLTGLGYRVAIARSGTEALEKIRRLQPCVIFLNPLLPMLSGWDLLVLLKADEETRHIPVMVTAMRVEKDKAYQNGADGFLNLPIQGEALQRSLDRLVNLPACDPQDSLPGPTVLHLYRSNNADQNSTAPLSAPELNSSLHLHHCRVLEVDDLEQADLLARVWKPNVILLDGFIPDPLSYIKQLSQYPFLASLPLVTLTAEVTHAANQISGLAVFPCLAPNIDRANIKANINQTEFQAAASSDSSENSALLQVIQLAAGINWTAHILVADFSVLEADWAFSSAQVPEKHVKASDSSSQVPDRLRALVQYVQIAGFRSSVGQSWKEVLQQLQHQSVDLLLLCAYSAEPHPLFLQMLQDLEQLEVMPPILVWNYQSSFTVLSEAEMERFRVMWGAIATQVFPPSLSMSELLAQINQTLASQQKND